VLRDFEGETVQPGDYRFPFILDLPDSLPSSLVWNNGTHSCSIDYKVSVKLRSSSERKSLATEKPLVLASASLRNVLVPCLLEPKTETIQSKAGIRLTKGSVTFGASVSDTQIGRGQDLNVAIACCNDSNVDIQNVSVKLIELIAYRQNDSTEFTEHTLTLNQLEDVSLPGIDKARATWEEQRKYGGTDLHIVNYEEIYNYLDSSNDHRIQLNIPMTTRDTYNGKLFQVRHFVKIKLHTPTMVGNPKMKIPLYIGYAPEPEEGENNNIQNLENSLLVPIAPPLPPRREMSARLTRGRSRPILVPFLNGYDELPIIAPIQPPPGVISAQTATVGSVLVGGTDVHDGNSAEFNYNPIIASTTGLGTLQGLLQEMFSSVDDLDIILEKVFDPIWAPVFKTLTSDGFGMVIAHVNLEVDQPRVAGLLAPIVDQFSCAHCVEAIKCTADWNRPSMVSAVVPYCFDLKRNKGLIERELTEWERVVTQHDFDTALQR